MGRSVLPIAILAVAGLVSTGCADSAPVDAEGENNTPSPNNMADTGTNNLTPTNNLVPSNNTTTNDFDGDGAPDSSDNCARTPNPDQDDSDNDQVGTICDNCPTVANHDQADSDGDGRGDACADIYDANQDTDEDSVPDRLDNCPEATNVDQADADSDGVGDSCDNCPSVANFQQADTDLDGRGDACDAEAPTDTCGDEAFAFESIKPNLLLVIDRSASMAWVTDAVRCPGNNEVSRWDIARDALTQVLTNFADQIRFGLLLFPGPNRLSCGSQNCQAGAVIHEIAEGTAATVSTDLTGLQDSPCLIQSFGDHSGNMCFQSTPIAGALNIAANYDGIGDASRDNFVLVLTDGEENCGGDPSDTVRSVRQRDPEVKTFVVGFTQGAAGARDELNEMADEGGTAQSGGGNRYYQADSALQLESALNEIANSVISCSLQLAEIPADPDRIYLVLGEQPLERDRDRLDGWDYIADTNQIEFFGNTCTSLQTLRELELRIVYGCPPQTCEPTPEVCDFVDNNCDGVIDEGCEGCGPEICDQDLDNDCDGKVDEGCEGCDGPERCDGRDNDCDGNIDEGANCG